MLAYLGLREAAVERAMLAETVWPDVDRARGLANLRSSLWRLPTPARAAVRGQGSRICLDERVNCDVRTLTRYGSEERRVGFVDLMALGWRDELLPGWYDDWVEFERQRLAVWRAGVLERLSTVCCAAGLHGEAILYAATALEIDPLREGAHRALLRAQVAQGNLVEAVDHYRYVERLFANELGVAPSDKTRAVVQT